MSKFTYCDECNTPGVENANALHLTPFGKVPCHDFLYVIRDMDASDIDGAVLPGEAAHASHVVSVVGELVALRNKVCQLLCEAQQQGASTYTETIHRWVEDVMDPRKAMQVLAVLALGADPARKVQAKVRPRHVVRPGVPRVQRDVASPLGLGLGEVFVFAITATPFVVPDVEDGARLWWWLALDQGGINLGPRGALLPPNDLLDLLFCWGGNFGAGCGERELLGIVASFELEGVLPRVDLCDFGHFV